MSKYLKYSIRNVDPVRIADDETSQHGQTDTLRYLPGSSIRGAVITQLAQGQDFAGEKRQLFSGEVHFLNAYPRVNGHELLPSFKGFYEDKQEIEGKKELNNVLEEEVVPGYKRAALGRFSYIEDDCIRYADVKVGEDLNINMGRENGDDGADKRNVFRSQYIKKNQTFTGYVTFSDAVDDALIGHIKEALTGTLYIGNRKSAGYGACVCEKVSPADGVPYGEIRTGKGGSQFYMVLLSDTVMRDPNGELTGLCMEALAQQLGCGKLQIDRCATSTADRRGYNRMWQGAVPSAVMYQAGSVFRLSASEPVPAEKLRGLEASGIGIRREEGFGQVAFIEGYPKLHCKLAADPDKEERIQTEYKFAKKEDIDSDIRIAAAGLLRSRLERCMEKYIVDHPLALPGISPSKQGILSSLCMELQYAPDEAKQQLLDFADHDYKKSSKQKVHGVRARQDALYRYVHKILEEDLFAMLGMEQSGNVMGIAVDVVCTQEDILKYKLELMVRQIRYANRRKKNDAD